MLNGIFQGREEKLKETVESLKRLVEEQQSTIKEKEHKILELFETFKTQVLHRLAFH